MKKKYLSSAKRSRKIMFKLQITFSVNSNPGSARGPSLSTTDRTCIQRLAASSFSMHVAPIDML